MTLSRRLAAILAADIAGYSRLMGADEEGTHVRLKEHLRVLLDPKVAAYRGHIVKNTGDGFLAEFNSVVDALRCAVDVQRGMAERNSDVAPHNRIEFRIGINVGDIIEDNGDIFGDDVNIAAVVNQPITCERIMAAPDCSTVKRTITPKFRILRSLLLW